MGDSQPGKSKSRTVQMPLQGKGNIAMRDLERSKQIRELSENRLRSDLGDLDSQEMNSILTIRRDQRILMEKLQNVQRSSGHYRAASKTQSQGSQKQKGKTLDCSGDLKDKVDISKKEVSRLPSLFDKQRSSMPAIESGNKKEKSDEILGDSDYEDPLKNSSELKKPTKDSLSLPAMRKRSKSEQNVNAAWYTNLNDIRSTINQRLSTSMNDLNNEKADIEKGLEPFMFAVPDGLPRTMYMMPSIDERFKQATKARYIRKPGTKLDPIERELNLNEIFKKGKNDDNGEL